MTRTHHAIPTFRLRPLAVLAAPWAGLLFLAGAAQAETTVRVFAAASLTDALDAAAARYESHRDVDVVPVYAASSTAARQIAHGAPADLYVSANRRWLDWLAAQGITLGGRSDLLHNRLVLVASTASGLSDYSPADASRPLASLLGDGGRLAVGDPDHVPAGIYTRQALESLGEWHSLEGRLARADNVRAALALVERGEAPLGIVYATDAHASEGVVRLGPLPASSHDPIAYQAALIGPSPSVAAAAFRDWLAGDEAMAVFTSFGFTPAGR